MKKFYILLEKLATVSQQLTYGHYVELLPIKEFEKINYYIMITEKHNLSVRQLRERIKNKEYERLDENTKLKLKRKDQTEGKDFVKNPIIIKNTSNYEVISEKILQKLIVEDLDNFLKELGNHFCLLVMNIK